ncbi:unnamed protein product [Arabis nemorensis]|uniref:RING-type domain-containing protein n=1 Tax=Arabis nemorensis TaxID=586526 RepID=A0A565AN11_9BRAS|nr:unnamed protein product [Arabis nemorensis]
MVLSHGRPLGEESEVVITEILEFEEFLVDKLDGTVSYNKSYPTSGPPRPPVFLSFLNFTPNYVYQQLYNQFNDHVVREEITDQIVVQALRERKTLASQRQHLCMMVVLKLTQQVFNVAPSISRQETVVVELETDKCSNCLENLLDSDTNPIHVLPNRVHLFHEKCVSNWINRRNSCREAVYRQPE